MLKSKPFKSQFDLKGSLLRPEKLIFFPNGITLLKPKWYLLLRNRSFISYNELRTFIVKSNLVKSQVFFKSKDSTEIIARGLSISDVEEIKLLINDKTELPRRGYV